MEDIYSALYRQELQFSVCKQTKTTDHLRLIDSKNNTIKKYS